jgi:hypothetical protein
MSPSDEKLRQFDLLLKNFQNIGKSQAFYVNLLVASICLIWLIETFHEKGGINISLLGTSLEITGVWGIVPLALGVLVLCLAGTVNLIQHAWRRLNLCLMEVCEEDDFFFPELDPYKNIVDYIGFVTFRLKTPVLPDTTDSARNSRRSWRISTLLYPALIFVSIETTYASLLHLPWEWRSWFYVFGSVLVQTVSSLPFIWRKLCIFFGVHTSDEEGIDWGTDALYKLPLPVLERAMKKGG